MHSRSNPLGFVGVGVCLFGFCLACGWANPTEPPSDALAPSGERQRLDQRLRSPTPSAPPKTKPDVVIYEGAYPGWPWVAKGPDGSYPASVQTGPHERLIVDYEIRPESKRIAGYFVVFPSDW